MSLASSGAAVSSSCLLTGYHCTVTQLGLSPSSRTVHAPTFTPEVGTVFDGPVSAASSPARPLKTSPGSSPETVRSCTTAVDEVQPKEVGTVPYCRFSALLVFLLKPMLKVGQAANRPCAQNYDFG